MGPAALDKDATASYVTAVREYRLDKSRPRAARRMARRPSGGACPPLAPAAPRPAPPPLPLTVLPTRDDVHRRFARDLFDEAAEAARLGREVTSIVPLGPKGHYPLLARMVNEAGLSLEHVAYVGMDQWLDWQGRPLPWGHPFNLESYFRRHFIELVEPDRKSVV